MKRCGNSLLTSHAERVCLRGLLQDNHVSYPVRVHVFDSIREIIAIKTFDIRHDLHDTIPETIINNSPITKTAPHGVRLV